MKRIKQEKRIRIIRTIRWRVFSGFTRHGCFLSLDGRHRYVHPEGYVFLRSSVGVDMTNLQNLLRAFVSPRWKSITILLLLAIHLTSAVQAQEYAEQLRRPFWMQGRQLRKAFSEVTQTPRNWTVKIFTKDKTVAYGAIVSQDGWIVTKGSQIQKARLCELPDGRRLPFEYIGLDTSLDLALIKVAATGLQTTAWESEDPQVGAWFITVDMESVPLGVGVMSVHRRKIPRSDVQGVLGIQLKVIDRPETDPAVIERVYPNSGGKTAGLLTGDEVLVVNETDVQSRAHLVETIGKFRPGDTLLLKVLRDEASVTLSATLTHPFGEFLSRIAFQEQMGGPLSFRRDGFTAVYQQDAVLSPEECGGPVVNIDGKAVGINIARAGRTATYVLPADLILEKLEDLKSGKFPPPIAKEAPDESDESSQEKSDDSE